MRHARSSELVYRTIKTKQMKRTMYMLAFAAMIGAFSACDNKDPGNGMDNSRTDGNVNNGENARGNNEVNTDEWDDGDSTSSDHAQP